MVMLDKYDKMFLSVLGLVVLIVLITSTIGIISSARIHDDFNKRCIAAGGKITDLRRNTLCVSDDGRILGYL